MPAPKKRILICCENSKFLREALTTLLAKEKITDHVIDACDNYVELPGPSSDYALVAVSDNLPGSPPTRIAPLAIIDWAIGWLGIRDGLVNSRHVILLTTCPWMDIPRGTFCSKLSGIKHQSAQEDIHLLLDMILAALAGQAFVEPTIVKAELCKEGKSLLVRMCDIDGVDGPLSFHLTLDVANQMRAPKSLSPKYAKNYAGAFQIESETKQSKKLEECGVALWKDLTYSDINTVHALTGKALCITPDSKLYPVHLHIYCDAKDMSVPIDLACLGGDRFLGREMPVVWRTRTERTPQKQTIQSGRKSAANPTTYNDMQVLHSCNKDVRIYMREGSMRDADPVMRELPGLNGAKSEAAGIKRHLLGSKSTQADPVCSKQELLSQASQDWLGNGRMVHIASHGVSDKSGVSSALIVGPNKSTSDKGERVTADDFLDHVERARQARVSWEPISFLYANCCELVQQSLKDEFIHYGSFIEELVAKGLCLEAIANRWKVFDASSAVLAQNFYKTRPLTSHGRAVALLHACRAAAKVGPMRKTDPTWLAPAHILVRGV